VPEINATVARNVLTSLITAYIHILQERPSGPDMWWLADYIMVTMRIGIQYKFSITKLNYSINLEYVNLSKSNN